MHRITLTAALAVALTGSLALAQQAQQPQAQTGATMHHGHHRHNPHREAMKLSKRLNLSPEQTSQIEPILASREQKMSALRSDTSLTPEARKQQFRALQQQSRQQVEAVLTPEQREQMKAMHHGHHHHGDEAAAPTGL